MNYWNFAKHGMPKGVEFSGRYIEGDAGQEIVRAAAETDGVIYMTIQRSWRVRLFSWPWRPWQKYVGESVPVRIASMQETDTPEGEVVSFYMEQVQPPQYGVRGTDGELR